MLKGDGSTGWPKGVNGGNCSSAAGTTGAPTEPGLVPGFLLTARLYLVSPSEVAQIELVTGRIAHVPLERSGSFGG